MIQFSKLARGRFSFGMSWYKLSWKNGTVRNGEMRMAFRVYMADIVEMWERGHIVCITVSLEVRHLDLCGVIDRGNAFDLAKRIPNLARKLGEYILIGKGEVGFIDERVIAFFTKPRSCRFERCLPDEVHRYNWGQKIPGGHCIADPVVVARSARQLLRLAIRERLQRVYLPIPGVGDGRLDVADIKEALDVLEHSSIVRLISNRHIEDAMIEMCGHEPGDDGEIEKT